MERRQIVSTTTETSASANRKKRIAVIEVDIATE